MKKGPENKNFKDLTGQKNARLLALRFAYMKGHDAWWVYKCDCGQEVILCGKKVTIGHTRSCGCLEMEETIKRLKKMSTKHGFWTEEPSIMKNFYMVWSSMKSRCINPNHKAFSNYGSRGIQVCERWLSFENFRDDMWKDYKVRVENGETVTLERRDVNKGYLPDNCYWATWKEQQNNRRTSVHSIDRMEFERQRSRLFALIRNTIFIYKRKNSPVFKRDIGCTPAQFKKHMVSQFTKGMNWDNYGNGREQWNIDHIIPCYKFDLAIEKDRLECFHYTNLRPMWRVDNESQILR